MQTQMGQVYAKAAEEFLEIDFIDLSIQNYAMDPETYQKWLTSKDSCKQVFIEELERILAKEHVQELFKNIMNQENKNFHGYAF